jgi:hypothetical protein
VDEELLLAALAYVRLLDGVGAAWQDVIEAVRATQKRPR